MLYQKPTLQFSKFHDLLLFLSSIYDLCVLNLFVKPLGIGPIVRDWDKAAPINIEMFTGIKFQNTVTLRHTVLNLKGMIMKSTEIQVTKQKLVYRENEMKVIVNTSIYLYLFDIVHFSFISTR